MTKEYRAFAVYKQELIPSRWGGTVWELHLADITDPNINYNTYISEENRNYVNWHKVIENPNKGIFLETERLRMKRQGQVNADTVFEVTVTDADQLADQLAIAWNCRRHAPVYIMNGYNYGHTVNP